MPTVAAQAKTVALWLPEDATVAKSAASAVPSNFINKLHRGSVFSGTQYLTKAAPITALADSKEITVAFTVRFDSIATQQTIVAHRNAALTTAGNVSFVCHLIISGSAYFQIYLNDGAGVNIATMTATGFVPVAGVTYSVAMSIDLNGSGTKLCYIDDVSKATSWAVGPTDTEIGFTTASSALYTVGARSDASTPLSGIIGHVSVTNQFIDLTVEANRRLFFDSDNLPIDSTSETLGSELVTAPNDLEDASWSTVNADIDDFETITEDTATGGHYARFDVTTSGNHRFVIDVERGSGSRHLWLDFYNASNQWLAFVVDPSDGTVTKQGVASSWGATGSLVSSELQSDGKYRLTFNLHVTFTQLLVGMSNSATPTFNSVSGLVSYTGDGASSVQVANIGLKTRTYSFESADTITAPNDLTDAAWTKTRATADDFETLREDSSASTTHFIVQTQTLQFGERSASFTVSPGAGTRWLTARFYVDATNWAFFLVDPATGTVSDVQQGSGNSFSSLSGETVDGVTTIRATGPTASTQLVLALSDTGSPSVTSGGAVTYTGDGVSSVKIGAVTMQNVITPSINLREWDTDATDPDSLALNTRGSAGALTVTGTLTKYAGYSLAQATEDSQPVAQINRLPADPRTWSEAISNGTWTAGIDDPNGGTGAYRFTVTNGASSAYHAELVSQRTGDKPVVSMWLRQVTGDPAVKFYNGNGANYATPADALSTSWKRHRVTVATVANGAASNYMGVVIENADTETGDQFDIFWPQGENTLGRALATPSAYMQPSAAPRSLVYDGVDDLMTATIAGLEQPTAVMLSFALLDWSQGRYIFDGISAATGVLYQHELEPDLKAYAGSYLTDLDSIVVGEKAAVLVVFNGASSSLRKNNLSPIEGDLGASDMGGVTVGARAGGTQFGNIEFFGMQVLDAVPTDHEISKILAYFGVGEGKLLRARRRKRR